MPPERLGCFFAGGRLERARQEAEALRAAGRYREARLTSPMTVRNAREVGQDQIVVEVLERWDDRLFESNGSLVSVAPSPVPRRYVLDSGYRPGLEVTPRVGCPETRWYVVEAEVSRLR